MKNMTKVFVLPLLTYKGIKREMCVQEGKFSPVRGIPPLF